MKKVTILSVLAATAAMSMVSTANAATTGTVCTAQASAGNGTAALDITATNEFVKVAFTPKCSANVHMGFQQSATAFGVASGSSKGKNYFGGGTGGGGVKAAGTCPTSGCTSAEGGTANATTFAIAS